MDFLIPKFRSKMHWCN
jgi:hypothetical protein